MKFTIEKACMEETKEIAELIDDVYEEMEQKDWYVKDREDDIKEWMESGKGIVFKAVEERTGEMAGILLTIYPGASMENLGRDIGLNANQLMRVAHMESAAVLPKFRGHKLQKQLLQAAEEEAKKRGCRYLMCTIHPDNYFSKGNAEKQGYHVMQTKQKYGRLTRDILLKTV